MNKLENKLNELALKTMFTLSKEEMPTMIEEYTIFIHYVEALEAIDTTNVVPLCFPYEEITTYLREDVVEDIITTEEALKNAPDAIDNQIRVPKVVK